MDASDGHSLLTSIYYLLTQDTHSAMHRLPADELYHFYLGDPVELLLLLPDGSGRILVLGNDLARGEMLQVLVPAGAWQGSRIRPGGRMALMGTTMSPGFRFSDYLQGSADELIERFPDWKDMIRTLSAPGSRGDGHREEHPGSVQ